MHPHRSSALDGAAAALTVARTRGVAVPLSWSWSHHPQGRAWAAAFARAETLGRTPLQHPVGVAQGGQCWGAVRSLAHGHALRECKPGPGAPQRVRGRPPVCSLPLPGPPPGDPAAPYVRAASPGFGRFGGRLGAPAAAPGSETTASPHLSGTNRWARAAALHSRVDLRGPAARPPFWASAGEADPHRRARARPGSESSARGRAYGSRGARRCASYHSRARHRAPPHSRRSAVFTRIWARGRAASRAPCGPRE